MGKKVPAPLSRKSDKVVESSECRLCEFVSVLGALAWFFTVFGFLTILLLVFGGIRTAIANTLIQAWATNSYLDDRGPGAGAAGTSNVAGGGGKL